MCGNSAYSSFCSILTSCSTSGLRVTMPVPRGRKSLPTTASSTELFPELCNSPPPSHVCVYVYIEHIDKRVCARHGKSGHRGGLDLEEGGCQWGKPLLRSPPSSPAVDTPQQRTALTLTHPPPLGCCWTHTCPPMTTMVESLFHSRLESLIAVSPKLVHMCWRRVTSCVTRSILRDKG